MAYKFQRNMAIMSGALDQEGSVTVFDQSGNPKAALGDDGEVSGSGNLATAGDLVIQDTYKLTSAGALHIASMGANWTNASRTVADMGTVTTIDINGGNIDGTVIGAASVAAGSFAAIVGTSLDCNGVGDFSDTLTLSKASGNGLVVTANADLNGDVDIAGALIANGDVDLGNAVTDAIICTGRFDSDLIPLTDSARDLGTSALQWAEAHIDTGNIDIVVAAQLSASAGLTSTGGNISGSHGLNIHGAAVNLPNIVDGAVSAGKTIVWSDGGLLKTESINDIAGLLAGTVTSTGISDASAVLSVDITNLGIQEALFAAPDEMMVYDASITSLKKVGVGDFVSGSLPLVSEAAMDVADDYILFLDGGATGQGKKEKWADLVALMAGSGLTATNGVLSSDAASTPNAITDGEVCAEGFNYMTGTAQSNCFLPQDPSLGDTVTVKAGNMAGGASLVISDPRSKTMDGDSKIYLESPYAAIKFVYAVSGSWSIV